MNINRFEDVMAWQKAKELAIGIHGVLGDSTDYSFKGQIWRASISVIIASQKDLNENRIRSLNISF
jgi:hypothetical protein